MNTKKNILFVCLLALLMGACSDDDNNEQQVGKNGPKPAMDLLVSPEGGLRYGDRISVTGLMTDERNLDHYELLLTNGAGDTLATKYQMLLGQEFTCDDYIQIPLPKDARTDDLMLEVKLENTRNGEVSEQFDLPAVGLPVFDVLYLVLGNGQVVDLVRRGDVFETPSEFVFPANVKGIISTTTSKSGIWWGMSGGEIASMARDSILIGGDVEASFTVAFNPVTFELTLGERHVWAPLPASDCYYILGTISGHWMDGEITTERAKMRMNGYESGTSAYYTWTAPDGDDPEVGMWGSTGAGEFRLVKGGGSEYILWDGRNIVQSPTDDKSKSFPVTAGGPFTIKVNFTDGQATTVEITGGGKSLVFGNGQVVVNGAVAAPQAAFCGSNLPMQEGASYIYEGYVSLTQGQTVSSEFDLSGFTANPDLFNGGGNPTWTLKSAGGEYYVRMDPFSGAFYACPTGAYPDFLYMDGWSWAPTASSNAVVWDAWNVLPLVRTAGGTYEGTFYNFGWGGDVAFYVTWPGSGTSTRLPISIFQTDYANPSNAPTSFRIPSGVGYYKVIIDLKDGVNIATDGTVTAKGTAPCTLDYTAL